MRTPIPISQCNELPAVYNIHRRLFAAVALQAARDLFLVNINDYHRCTARQFLIREADFLVDEFGANAEKIDDLLAQSEAFHA